MQKQSPTSSVSGSGSEIDPQNVSLDEKKRKRMISNRESARRSRMRKQKQLADLANEATKLENENGEMREKIDLIFRRYVEIESANNVLRAQVMELTERLRSLSSVLVIVADVSGLAMEIPEVPNPLLKPWHLACPVRPVVASTAGMFRSKVVT